MGDLGDLTAKTKVMLCEASFLEGLVDNKHRDYPSRLSLFSSALPEYVRLGTLQRPKVYSGSQF